MMQRMKKMLMILKLVNRLRNRIKLMKVRKNICRKNNSLQIKEKRNKKRRNKKKTNKKGK